MTLTLMLELKEAYHNLLNKWKGKNLPHYEWFIFIRKFEEVMK